IKKTWNERVKKDFDKTSLRFCVNRCSDLNSDFPLKSILTNDWFGVSNIEVVSKYLIKFIDRKGVEEKLIDKFLRSSYLYEKIIILKTLLYADRNKYFRKRYFDISVFDKSVIYASNNFLLIGYFLIFISKFGDEGSQRNIREDFNSRFNNDERIARYYMYALSFHTQEV